MDGLQSIMVEIVEIIFNLSKADLLNISYVSRRVRDISQPVLYCAVPLYSLRVSEVDRPPNAHGIFVRTLPTLQDEVFVSCVSSLRLQPGCQSYHDDAADCPHLFLHDTSNLDPRPRCRLSVHWSQTRKYCFSGLGSQNSMFSTSR